MKIVQLLTWHGLERIEAERAEAGDIVAVAGIEEINIGDTIADREHPRAMPAHPHRRADHRHDLRRQHLAVGGTRRHLRHLAQAARATRLAREQRNVSVRIEDTDSPDALRVTGRGELQLAILIETMRREGYELQVSKPTVVTRHVDGGLHEPVELLLIDVPEDYIGVVSQLLAVRRGKMTKMTHTGSGRVPLEFDVPSRGLIGFRSRFLTETRGTGIMNALFNGWAPWHGDIQARTNGAMVADREGLATPYAVFHMQERGVLFVPPGTRVYEGMVIGEYSRGTDLHVNICREKKLTNIRAAGRDENVIITPPRDMGLEAGIEWIADDELVEVTPTSIRLRKRVLRKTWERSVSHAAPLAHPPVLAGASDDVIGSVDWRLLALFVIGLLISLIMLARSQVGGDQFNLLARGWLLADEGVWIQYGNPTSAGGNEPGGLTSLLVGLPLMVWRDYRAPVAA